MIFQKFLSIYQVIWVKYLENFQKIVSWKFIEVIVSFQLSIKFGHGNLCIHKCKVSHFKHSGEKFILYYKCSYNMKRWHEKFFTGVGNSTVELPTPLHFTNIYTCWQCYWCWPDVGKSTDPIQVLYYISNKYTAYWQSPKPFKLKCIHSIKTISWV